MTEILVEIGKNVVEIVIGGLIVNYIVKKWF